MKQSDLKSIKHELDGIHANLMTCFRRISENRRAKNPYAELGLEALQKLAGVIETIESDTQNSKSLSKNKSAGNKEEDI